MTVKSRNPHAVALGRLGGKAGTYRQNQARRENGRKGGRGNKSITRLRAENVARLVDRATKEGKRP